MPEILAEEAMMQAKRKAQAQALTRVEPTQFVFHILDDAVFVKNISCLFVCCALHDSDAYG